MAAMEAASEHDWMSFEETDGSWSTQAPLPEESESSGGSSSSSSRWAAAVIPSALQAPWWVWQVTTSLAGLRKDGVYLSVGFNNFERPGACESSAPAGFDCSTFLEPKPRAPKLRLLRKEPLRAWLPALLPYEIAQLSLLTFLVAFLMTLRLQAVYQLLAIPALALIPIIRVCPELFFALPRLSRQPVARRPLNIAGVCLAAVVSGLLLCSLLRYTAKSRGWAGWRVDGPHSRSALGSRATEVEAMCRTLGGTDCSLDLPAWSSEGEDVCTVLVQTEGSCANFCSSHGLRCVRGADDEGTGRCVTQDRAHERQSTEGEGCFQSWTTQICACAPPLPPPASPSSSDSDSDLDRVSGLGSETPTVGAPTPAEMGSVLSEDRWDLTLEPERIPPCFFKDTANEPLNMPGQGRTTAASAMECQRRCKRTRGCAQFTWFTDGGCHLQLFSATRRPSHPGVAVTGPSDCDEEAEVQSLLGTEPSPPPPQPQPQPPSTPLRPSPAGAKRSSQPPAPPSPPSTRTPEPSRPPPSPLSPGQKLSTSATFLGEASPYLLVMLLLAFLGLAISGVVEKLSN